MLIHLLKRNFDDTKIIKKSEWAMLHTCLFSSNPRYTIMYILNIPYTELKLELRDDKRIYVWDFIRRRWLKTTPEEWVRQQFSHWLTDILGYPKARLAHEISLEQNGMSKRADAVFYDKEGRPLIIFEFKAPHVELTQETFNQIYRYNLVLRVPYLIVSNGMKTYCCHIVDGKAQFLKEIPPFSQLSV